MASKGNGKGGRQTPRKSAQKRTKQPKKDPLLTPKERQQIALHMLYGSEAVAYRVRGRKSLFKENMYDEGEKLAALGLTLQEIADFWGVHYRTLQRWAEKRADFRHTIKKAKQEADLQVEGSLFKKAKGYDYTEEHYELRQPPAGEGAEQPKPVMTLVKTVRKHISADTTAIIFWLLNRQRDRWKDKRQLEVAPGTKLPLEIIISNGDATRRIGAEDKENRALPASRESTTKP